MAVRSFTFVDTPGAYPGLGAEERGQAEAIAHNLREMARLQIPIITTITGEGGSGGALAIAIADRVLMMENSIYSVISPEGCASIMWRDPTKKALAAAGHAHHRRGLDRNWAASTASCPNPRVAPTSITKPPPPCSMPLWRSNSPN